MPFADRFSPPLTTIRIPHYEIGDGGRASSCSSACSDGDSEPRDVRLEPTLVVRDSTGPPRRRARGLPAATVA